MPCDIDASTLHAPTASACRPSVTTLVTHIMQHCRSRNILLLGNWEEAQFNGSPCRCVFISDADPGVTMHQAESVLNGFGSDACIILEKVGLSAPVSFDLLSRFRGQCELLILVGLPTERWDPPVSGSLLIRPQEWELLSHGVAQRSDGLFEQVSLYCSARICTLAPSTFKVAAIITGYNEIDVLPFVVEHLLQQEIDVYYIDNWSDDGTYEVMLDRFADRLIGIERFPAESATALFDLRSQLTRKEQVANFIDASWIIHQDADEFRYSPFDFGSLRDGLFVVDQSGYNAINHTVVEFPPYEEADTTLVNPEVRLSRFRFGRQPSDLVQVKAWKKDQAPVRLASRAGHDLEFQGKRVYPLNFLLKHYPIRSQEHGMRKVFQERLPRYSPEEKLAGWHIHYSSLQSNHVFGSSGATLESFEARDFARRFFVQRLTGCGSLEGLSRARGDAP